MAEYVQQATPETLSAIMGFDSGLIDSTLFRDLMDARILIERECTRLACAKLTPASLQMLQAHAEAVRMWAPEVVLQMPDRDLGESGLCDGVPEL